MAVSNLLADPRYLKFRERYYDNFEQYVLDNCPYTPTWQQIDFCRACQVPGARVAVASGHGCFGKGTMMHLWTGEDIPVEKIEIGFPLIGDDGEPRVVLSTCHGQENMYRFYFWGGKSHVYNESHILCLLNSERQVCEIPVREFLSWGADKRSSFVAYRPYPYSIFLERPAIEPITRVEYVGFDDYYGFTLDGNHRFLSDDYMVLRNTGKSFCLAWLLDWNMRVFPHSNALLTATNIEQARSVVWKYLDGVIEAVDSMYPWMAGFFIKETRRYYARGYKDSWYVLPKTASKSAPENLAGQHNNNLLIVVDEASGVDDAIHGVLRGALTHRRNRYIMTSQPTRPAGHFADAMTRLAKQDGSDAGIYTAITMNSEESPLVGLRFIKEKLEEYGGHHSPEYQIKVLGRFPDNMFGYLIARQWAEDCQYNTINFSDGDWGYVLLADVAEGMHRDSSVCHIVRMGGQDKERRVESVSCEEFLDMNEIAFARYIASKYHEYPNLTIAVDGDGAGRTVILELEGVGIPVTQIHWGLPCYTKAAQARYVNLRAYAHCKLREAIYDRRFRGPRSRKFVDQASKLPFEIDERGRYKMETKERMRAKGIKSPDLCDTCCFAFLVDYIPAETGIKRNTRINEFYEMARAMQGEEQ